MVQWKISGGWIVCCILIICALHQQIIIQLYALKDIQESALGICSELQALPVMPMHGALHASMQLARPRLQGMLYG